ncbi:unnamed protein product, partial [Amoebophrya sp. A120]
TVSDFLERSNATLFYESTGWQDYSDVVVDANLQTLKFYGQLNFNLTVFTSTKAATPWAADEYTLSRRGRRLTMHKVADDASRDPRKARNQLAHPDYNHRHGTDRILSQIADVVFGRSSVGDEQPTVHGGSSESEGAIAMERDINAATEGAFESSELDDTDDEKSEENASVRALTASSGSSHTQQLFSTPYEESVVFLAQKAPKVAVSVYGQPTNLLFGIPEYDALVGPGPLTAQGVPRPKPTLYWSLQGAVTGAASQRWYRVSQSD